MLTESILFDCRTDKDAEHKPLTCCRYDCKKYYQYHCQHCVKTKPIKESTERISGTSISTLRDDVESDMESSDQPTDENANETAADSNPSKEAVSPLSESMLGLAETDY